MKAAAAVPPRTALGPNCLDKQLIPLACLSAFSVMIVDGKMQYLFDETGRRYLDVSADLESLGSTFGCGQRVAVPAAAAAVLCCAPLAVGCITRLRSPARPPCCSQHASHHHTLPALQGFAGIVTVSVGHCHPEVNKAVIEQTQRLQVRAGGLCCDPQPGVHAVMCCALQPSCEHGKLGGQMQWRGVWGWGRHKSGGGVQCCGSSAGQSKCDPTPSPLQRATTI